MPMPAGFEWISELPGWAQTVLYFGAGVGGIILARGGFTSGKKEPPVTSKDMVLTAASITDMSAVRVLSDNVEKLVKAQSDTATAVVGCSKELESIREILEQDADDRREYMLLKQGIAIGQQKTTRTR